MSLFGKKEKSYDEELPPEYRKMMTIFDKVYNSPEYVKRRKDFDRWLDIYKGELWQTEGINALEAWESKIQVNYIFSTIQAQCPLLTDNRPIWHIRARDPVYQNLSTLYGKALEYLWDKNELDNEHFLVENDALLYGTGLTKDYWNIEEDEIQGEVEDPRCFVIAPGYDDLWKAPWCGTKKRKSMSWVKMHYPEKYKNVKPDTENDKNYDPEGATEMELEDTQVTIYEIWLRDNSITEYIEEYIDKDEYGQQIEKKEKKYKKKYENGRICIFTKCVVLSDPENEESPFKHGKPPWTVYYDYRVPHEFWGMGEPKQIEELHKEFNKQLQAAVKHARLSEDPNYLIDTSIMGEEIEDVKAEFWEGGNIWAADLSRVDKIPPIVKVEEGTMDQVHIELLRILPQAMQEVSGITDMTKGMASKKERQSASEVSILIESSYTRTRQKVRILEWAIKRRATLHVEMMQQFYESARYINFKREGEEGQELEYAMVGNSTNVFRESNMLPRIRLESGEIEPEQNYQQRLSTDKIFAETEKLIKEVYKKVDRVYFKFDIEIQTNSTLPQDKQSLANLMLRLAEIQVTPNSIVDDVAVMEQLQIPNREAIKARKDQAKQVEAMARQKQARPVQQGGAKPIPFGGKAQLPNVVAGGQR